jgi:hypothetical protein
MWCFAQDEQTRAEVTVTLTHEAPSSEAIP